MNNNLYLPNGFVNPLPLLDSKAFISIGIGARAIGKTYGCLLTLYERKKPFLYVRRTQTQLDETCIQALNPYNTIARDNGLCICTERLGKHSVGFYNGEKDKDTIKPVGNPFAVGVALSTFASIRGISVDADTLLFDEIIPERHERTVIKNEGEAFLNMLESVNRNRELKGEKPLHVVLLSNSNTINSQILDSIGVLKTIDEMSRRGIERKVVNDGLIDIIMYRDSPISERKKASALYRVANNRDFSTMALDNQFARADYEQVKTCPLNEYRKLVSVGNVTICTHKSKTEYYVIDGATANTRYDVTPLSLSAFKRKYGYIFAYYQRQKMYFSSVTAKINFERIVENA